MVPYLEDEVNAFIGGMDSLDDGIKALSSMINRFNRASLYIGVGPNGRMLGIDIPEGIDRIIFERMEEKLNHMPKVSVNILTEGGVSCIRVYAEGYETPYAYEGWFYGRKCSRRKDPESGEVVTEWKATLTCGMKRH